MHAHMALIVTIKSDIFAMMIKWKWPLVPLRSAQIIKLSQIPNYHLKNIDIPCLWQV